MLVKAKQDHKAYGDITRLAKDRLYIVYAVEHGPAGDEYSVFPAGRVLQDYDEPDPLFFPSYAFEVLSDKVSAAWQTKEVETAVGLIKYSSFPEWFENDFHIRAHDWNLVGDDYEIIRKYKQKYEALYKDYLPK
jgi:hypothetical protein